MLGKVPDARNMSALQTAIGAMLDNPLIASNQPVSAGQGPASPRFSAALNGICRDMASLRGELARAHPDDLPADDHTNGTNSARRPLEGAKSRAGSSA